ncbi:MAG: hypothetical protein ACPGO5_03310 [Patescibacteria group bacterium]
MDKKKIIPLVILVIVLVVVGVFYYQTSNEKVSTDIVDTFSENQITFTDIAEKYIDDYTPLYEFCKTNDRDYKIGGYFFSSKDSVVKSNPAPAGGEELNYNEFLLKIDLTDEEFDYYMDFVNAFESVKCIEGDINFKYGKERAVMFKSEYSSDKEGLVYVTDGSISENVNNQYLEENFEELTKIGDSNWYLYKRP